MDNATNELLFQKVTPVALNIYKHILHDQNCPGCEVIKLVFLLAKNTNSAVAS